ncbi:MAG: DUF2520 domain-containing protein [Chloroflexota bacterium]|nr:DUF2520 domain-containing protein [Chloroflexota bacterium]
MQKIGFIGAGPVGTAFGVRLSQQNYEVSAVYDLNPTAAQRFARAIPGCHVYESGQDFADAVGFVFITTPDDIIPKVAAQLNWHPGQVVIHCSGASSTDILEPARQKGAMVGCIHPCQTFASIDQAIENLPGSTFAIEAEAPVLGMLKGIVSALSGNWLRLKAEDKALYHAAAAIVCNYFCTIVKVATDLWQNFGKSTAEATQAYMPILRATVNNIGSVGLPNCLTGPIARGDLNTIRKHIDALGGKAPSVLALYKALGMETVPIALAKGTIDEDTAAKLRELLKPD